MEEPVQDWSEISETATLLASTVYGRMLTVIVPDAGELQPYVYLCAGWNLLVEVGVSDGINLDKPTRARKVGNEM